MFFQQMANKGLKNHPAYVKNQVCPDWLAGELNIQNHSNHAPAQNNQTPSVVNRNFQLTTRRFPASPVNRKNQDRKMGLRHDCSLNHQVSESGNCPESASQVCGHLSTVRRSKSETLKNIFYLHR